MCCYVARGSHSFFEMVDVFNLPNVREIFKTEGVTLDLNWPDDVLDGAMNDAIEYTKTLCLKRKVNHDTTKLCLQKGVDQAISEYKAEGLKGP